MQHLIQHVMQHFNSQYLIHLIKQEQKVGYLKLKYLHLNSMKILLTKLEMMRKE